MADLDALVTSLPPPTVAVIGGGYAGMAASVVLAERGIASCVFESSRILGGRARRVDYRDEVLDNGQHILSGAYSQLLRLMEVVGVPPDACRRQPLVLDMPPDFHLAAPAWPAPLHLAWALFTARGLGWRDRLAAVTFVGSSRVDLQACKLEYSIVSPK